MWLNGAPDPGSRRGGSSAGGDGRHPPAEPANEASARTAPGNDEGSPSGSLRGHTMSPSRGVTAGSILPAAERGAGAVQGHVVEVGRDLVAGTPVSQVILCLPGGIH